MRHASLAPNRYLMKIKFMLCCLLDRSMLVSSVDVLLSLVDQDSDIRLSNKAREQRCDILKNCPCFASAVTLDYSSATMMTSCSLAYGFRRLLSFATASVCPTPIT